MRALAGPARDSTPSPCRRAPFELGVGERPVGGDQGGCSPCHGRCRRAALGRSVRRSRQNRVIGSVPSQASAAARMAANPQARDRLGSSSSTMNPSVGDVSTQQVRASPITPRRPARHRSRRTPLTLGLVVIADQREMVQAVLAAGEEVAEHAQVVVLLADELDLRCRRHAGIAAVLAGKSAGCRDGGRRWRRPRRTRRTAPPALRTQPYSARPLEIGHDPAHLHEGRVHQRRRAHQPITGKRLPFRCCHSSIIAWSKLGHGEPFQQRPRAGRRAATPTAAGPSGSHPRRGSSGGCGP